MICKIVQIWTAFTEDGDPPALLRGHVAHCRVCRGRVQSHDRVARELVQQAPAFSPTPHPFLERKILNALSRAELERPKTSGYLRWALPCGGVLAMLLVVLVTMQPGPTDPDGQLAVDTTVDSGVQTDVLSGVPAFNLEGLSERLEKPFATEASALVSDARSAAQTFAANFIPTSWSSSADR